MSMNLKIWLPHRVFKAIDHVEMIVFETAKGSYGLLPHRLDCVAAIVPGILAYETNDGERRYLALDEGILIKTGPEVSVSVRNAVGDVELGRLREAIDKEFASVHDMEKDIRHAMMKLESGFIRHFEKLRRE